MLIDVKNYIVCFFGLEVIKQCIFALAVKDKNYLPMFIVDLSNLSIETYFTKRETSKDSDLLNHT